MPNQEYFNEAITWFQEIYQHCEPVEYPVLRAYVFCYHCIRLCSEIQGLVNTGDLDMLLSSSPSILQDIEEVERAIYPFSHEDPIAEWVVEPPLEPYDYANRGYTGTSVLRSNHRMRLSYYLFDFLHHASRAPGCTSQQQILFIGIQNRCIEEVQTLRKKISTFLDLIPDTRFRALANAGASIFLHQPTTIGRARESREGFSIATF